MAVVWMEELYSASVYSSARAWASSPLARRLWIAWAVARASALEVSRAAVFSSSVISTVLPSSSVCSSTVAWTVKTV